MSVFACRSLQGPQRPASLGPCPYPQQRRAPDLPHASVADTAVRVRGCPAPLLPLVGVTAPLIQVPLPALCHLGGRGGRE